MSDLLGCEVVDDDGRSYGHVHDALLVQDGPVLQSGFAAYRVHGLAAGPHAVGTQLGYMNVVIEHDTPLTRGPAPIRSFVQWLQRDAVYVPWETITSIDAQRIVVAQAPVPMSNRS
jgi:sporulation protein YlmC with PRC-barrel domain